MVIKGKWLCRGLLCLVLAVAWYCLPTPLSAAEFSADMTQQLSSMVMKGKFYMKGDKVRNEMEMMGATRASIVRKDKGVVWILMPKRQKYMELPFTEEAKNNPHLYQDELDEIAVKKELGEEKVNGFACKKYLYTFNDPSRGTMMQWYAEKLEFPVKMLFKGNNWEMTTEFSNIKQGSVDDSLFELPAGYTKMEMPAGTPGVMPPGTGQSGMSGSPHVRK